MDRTATGCCNTLLVARLVILLLLTMDEGMEISEIALS